MTSLLSCRLENLLQCIPTVRVTSQYQIVLDLAYLRGIVAENNLIRFRFTRYQIHFELVSNIF